jgi:hypothetical protein
MQGKETQEKARTPVEGVWGRCIVGSLTCSKGLTAWPRIADETSKSWETRKDPEQTQRCEHSQGEDRFSTPPQPAAGQFSKDFKMFHSAICADLPHFCPDCARIC